MLLNANFSACLGEVDPASPLTLLTPDSCRQYVCFPEGLTTLWGLKERQSHMAKKQYCEITDSVWLEVYGMKMKMKYRQDLQDAEELEFVRGSEKSA